MHDFQGLFPSQCYQPSFVGWRAVVRLCVSGEVGVRGSPCCARVQVRAPSSFGVGGGGGESLYLFFLSLWFRFRACKFLLSFLIAQWCCHPYFRVLLFRCSPRIWMSCYSLPIYSNIMWFFAHMYSCLPIFLTILSGAYDRYLKWVSFAIS